MLRNSSFQVMAFIYFQRFLYNHMSKKSFLTLEYDGSLVFGRNALSLEYFLL
ncbi:hypothetical protein ES332_A13G050000v1 [Gossypium tomentosum]|uniref:Uncharacterized protein n=1 Tax=Gossypium tomentosum TaxID=34277 RepID=A0A5D2MGH0_GOSTO|nr:hypothetical protein ES332_A13G050000v1 [Gossypium tomentosum]